MTNIIFYCNWGSSPRELLDRYKLMTKNDSGIWNNLIGVTDFNKADIIIFIEGIPNNFNLNLLNYKKFICLPREPLVNKNWERFNLPTGFTYDNFIHVVTNPQFIDKNYDFLSSLEYKESDNLFSAIISNKNNGLGYKLRRSILLNLSKNYPNLCDIYGAGWGKELGSSYKGELDGYHKNTMSKNTKFSGLINYKYSLCIENCSRKNYFSEKFTDAILCWTIPIYYGCTNIAEYFPKDSYYEVNINEDNCIEKIKTIINKPITKKNILALKQARDLILNKYNIWSVIENKVI